jgi:hypothetical protein
MSELVFNERKMIETYVEWKGSHWHFTIDPVRFEAGYSEPVQYSVFQKAVSGGCINMGVFADYESAKKAVEERVKSWNL